MLEVLSSPNIPVDSFHPAANQPGILYRLNSGSNPRIWPGSLIPISDSCPHEICPILVNGRITRQNGRVCITKMKRKYEIPPLQGLLLEEAIRKAESHFASVFKEVPRFYGLYTSPEGLQTLVLLRLPSVKTRVSLGRHTPSKEEGLTDVMLVKRIINRTRIFGQADRAFRRSALPCTPCLLQDALERLFGEQSAGYCS
jgi:hypothetical protein